MSWAIWITGPPGSGKSVIARGVEAEFRVLGQPVTRLELDEIRQSITPAPCYTDHEREIVYRALGYMATLLVEAGGPVLIDATAHRRFWRDLVRKAVRHFAEVQLVCPLTICQEREHGRTPGYAPRDIYHQAGGVGASVPGVDVPYEAALAPEVLIDTSVLTVGESVDQVMHLAGHLARAAGGVSAPTRKWGPGWAIWITGRPGSGKSTLAMRVADALHKRGVRVHLLDLAPVQRFLLAGQPGGEAEQDLVHRVLAYAAKLLTEAGVSVIVDATAVRRAWRDAARALIPCFAEIQLLCPTEVCLERERAVRWGLTFETTAAPAAAKPDIAVDYEETTRPELAIRTDVYDAHAAAERVLSVIQRLAGSERRGVTMPRRVLVVDDEADFLATYERLLRREGYDVVTVTSRAAGLAALDGEPPHLVISDLRLPDGDGLDVVRAAHGGRDPLPVIVVTGYPSAENRRAALAAGATMFVAKPFAAAMLLAAIRSSLNEPAGRRLP